MKQLNQYSARKGFRVSSRCPGNICYGSKDQEEPIKDSSIRLSRDRDRMKALSIRSLQSILKLAEDSKKANYAVFQRVLKGNLFLTRTMSG